MSIADTIAKAVEAVGSQSELAKRLGIPPTHLSAFKNGTRPYSYQKHAEIAAAAGMHEEARRIIVQGIADTLRDDVPHEAEAKKGFLAMLKALPEKAKSKSLRMPGFVVQILAQNGHFFTARFAGYKALCG